MSRPSRHRAARGRRTRVVTLPQLMSTAVEADPDGTAIVLADAAGTLAELTYAELDERSTRLARLLIARGIGPEDLVGVAFPRSLEAVIALWAVAKSGAGFVPIDPDAPAQRIAHIVVDSGVVLGLTVAAARAALPGTAPWLAVDTAAVAVALEEFDADPVTYADRLRPLRAEHPAYVVYTVDAIGAPHGVVVTQAGLSVLSDAQRTRCQADGDSRTLAFAAPSDDASVLELLLAVGGAATMVVAAPSVRGADELAPLLLREDITHAYLPPEVLESIDPAGLDELRVVICAGRSYPPELVDRWTQPIGAGPFGAAVRRFLHGYGSVETTVLTNIGTPDSPAEASGIGAPNPGITQYVLDERLSVVLDGETGELYIAGAQLARGYLRRPARTAAHFVANPFLGGPEGAGLSAADSRLFRTGDQVRRSADGSIEYIGPATAVVTAGVMPVRDRLDRVPGEKGSGAGADAGGVSAGPRPTSGEGAADRPLTVGDSSVFPGSQVRDDTAGAASVENASGTSRGDEPFANASAGWGSRSRPADADRVEEAVTSADSFEVGRDHSFAEADSSGERGSGAWDADGPGGESADSVVSAGEVSPATASGSDSAMSEGAYENWKQAAGSAAHDKVDADASAESDRTFPARDSIAVRESAGSADAAGDRASEIDGVGASHDPGTQPERIPLTAMPRPATTVAFEDTVLPGVPLSAAQQRMWDINRSNPETVAHNVCFAVRVSGRMRVEALQVAVVDVIERHEMLRTVYPQSDGTGYQVVLPLDRVLADLAPEPLQESEIEDWLGDYARLAFDVTAEIPVRIGVAQIAEDDHVVVVVAHRIAADEASVTPFLRDLAVALLGRRNRAKPSWAALPLQYADYALWQRSVLGDAAQPGSLAAREIAYWRTALAGITDGPGLPADRQRPARSSGRGAVYAFSVDREVQAGLLELARIAGGTLFTALHAGFAALIGRLSSASDIVVGTSVPGRGAGELDSAIGLFENPVVLRARVDPTMSFADLLAAVTRHDLTAFEHAELPFGLLAEALGAGSARAYPSWLRVALSVRQDHSAQVNLPGLTATAIEFGGGGAEFDLRLNVFPRIRDGAPDGLSATFTYATDLFDEITVAGFADRLVLLLEAVTADPRRPVGDVELLQPDERMRILGDWNNTRHAVEPGLLLDGYRRAVREHPDAIAVSSADLELTYIEFDTRVNQLARLLISCGVGPETTVVLAIAPSLDLLIGMYAILTAGGAYVPVNPDHPAELIGYILETVRPVCVVSTVADSVAVPRDTQSLRLDTLDLSGFDPSPVRPEELTRPLRPGHPAYVMFTSGSTGRPKGVVVSHAAIDHQLAWMLAAYPLASEDVYLQKTPPTYDASLWGYFLPLRAGARLRLAAPDRSDPLYLAESIIAHGVTVTDFAPSQLAAFAERTAPGICPTLREIFVIGEVLPARTVAAFARISDARVHNLYGPTEATVSVTYWPAASADGVNVPIGLPQWNTRVYVLDDRLRPVPVGVPGELYLAGAALARGYANRPGHTADRFVADPFSDQDAGGRMYRTGDLVVWRESSGELPARLDFLGRTDFQINIRGRRIEPGDIEAALLVQPSVGDAVVVARNGRLVAYVAPGPDKRIVTERVAASLAEVLPEELIPDVVVPMDALPRTAAGKLDRRELPDLALGVETSSSLKVVRVGAPAPRTPEPASPPPVPNETAPAAESGWLSKQWKLGPLPGSDTSVEPEPEPEPEPVESESRIGLPRRATGESGQRDDADQSATAPNSDAEVSAEPERVMLPRRPRAAAHRRDDADQSDSGVQPGSRVELPGRSGDASGRRGDTDGPGSGAELSAGSGSVESESRVGLPRRSRGEPGRQVEGDEAGSASSHAGWSPRVVSSQQTGAQDGGPSESDSSSRSELVRLPRRAAGWSPRASSSDDLGVRDEGAAESDRGSLASGGWQPRVVFSTQEPDAGDDTRTESDTASDGSSDESAPEATLDSLKPGSGLSSLRAGFDRGSRSGTGWSDPSEPSSAPSTDRTAESPDRPALRRSRDESESVPDSLSDNGSQADPRTMLLPRWSVPQEPEAAAAGAARADAEPVPLSPTQEWLRALGRDEQGGHVPAAFHLPFALRLAGSLDVESLGAALDDVIARHEVLRTVYPPAGEPGSGAVQRILPAVPRPPLTARPIARAEIPAAVRELAAAPFDVTAEPPLRVRLFEIIDLAPGSRREHILAMVVHRIAADSSALGPIVADLMVAYAARTANHSPRWAPLSAQYADYVRWQQSMLGSESDPESVAAQQIGYWRGELAGLPDVLDLPGARPRPEVASMVGAWTGVHIDAGTHTALLQLAHTHATTLFTVLETALAAFLARLSNGDDIAIGTPAPGRAAGEFEDLIGSFVNTVVLRTRLHSAESFSDLLIRQRDSQEQAFAHADLPFASLVEALGIRPSTARNPLYQVGISVQAPARTTVDLPGLTVENLDTELEVAPVDLNLTVTETYDSDGNPSGIDGRITYATDLFDPSAAEALAAGLTELLATLVADPTRPLGVIGIGDLGPADESGALALAHISESAAVPAEHRDDASAAGVDTLPPLAQRRGTSSAAPETPVASATSDEDFADRSGPGRAIDPARVDSRDSDAASSEPGDGPTLVSLLEDAAKAQPERVGIISSSAENAGEPAEFTLGELDAWSNRLARYLISLGVGRGSGVALAVRRSVDLGVAVYAVAKAGGASLPIDPEGDAERNRQILAGAGPVCVLADAEYPFMASNRPGGDGSFDAPTELLTPIGRTPVHRPAAGKQPMVVRVDRLNLDGIPTHRLADAERIEPLRASHPAWIIQSAGSDRVVVSHAGAVGQLTGGTTEFGLDSDGRALLATAATADLSVWEFWTVAVGALVQLGEQAVRPRTVPELMTVAVAANPDGAAVVFRGRSFTYTQLDRASSKLARRLIQLGAGPEKPVAVAIPRSLEALVTLWSVAKTGAAVVPVEPSLPGERITDLVSDSGAVLGVTVRAVVASLPQIDGEWLVLDHPNFAAEVDAQAGEPISDSERITSLLPDDGAYVLYGSADIDHSQGIVVAHEDLTDLAEQANHYRLHHDSRVLALAAPSSDEAVLELVLALGAAAALVVAPATIGGGPELARLIRSERVTHAFLPEAALRTVDPASLDGVEVVVTDRAVAEQEEFAPEVDYSAQGGYAEQADYTEHVEYPAQPGQPGQSGYSEQDGYSAESGYGEYSEYSEHSDYTEDAQDGEYSEHSDYTEDTQDGEDPEYAERPEQSERAGYLSEAGYSRETSYAREFGRTEQTHPEHTEHSEAPAPPERPMTPAERIIAEARASAPPPEEFDSATALSAPMRTPARRALPNRAAAALPRRGARAAEPAEPDAPTDSASPQSEPDEQGMLPLPPRAIRLLEIDPSGRQSRAIALDVPPGVPTENIRAAVRTIMRRHPLLSARLTVPGRTGDDSLHAWSPVFAGSAHEARLVLPQTPPEVSPRRFAHSEGIAEMAVRTLAVELDPGQGRNIGFGVIDPPELAGPQDDSRTLVIAANGLVVDDVSWRIIIDELSRIWSNGHTELADPAQAAPAGVAHALSRGADDVVRGEVSWWRRALADLPAESPLDGVDLTARGRVSLVITTEGAAAVSAVAASYHTDVEDVLLTALALAMLPDTRAAEILGPVVQLTVDGRSIAGGESAGAVGGFTATYPLAPNLGGIDLAEALGGGAAAGAAISRVKEQRRAVPAGGARYGLLRYLDPATATEIAALANGRTAFRYRDLRPARPYPDTPAADLFLDLTVDATEEGLRARFDYASAVLAADEVKELAGHWVRSLGALAEHGTRPEAGGFTPSDFPMVPLAQDDIDRLRQANPDLTDLWPVSPGQAGLLATAHRTGGAQFAVDLRGPLDDRRLRLSAQAVLDRHDGLRVAFGEWAGGPVQVISDPVDIAWRTVDFTDLSPADARVEVERYQAADRLAPFDPQSAPLIRFVLLKSAGATHRVLLTAHPLLLDDRSLRLVMRDLLTVYARGPRSRQLPEVHPYHAYPTWLAAQNGPAARAVWREALSGYRAPALLGHAESHGIASATAEVGVELLPADAVELSGLATRLGVTVQMVVQAAWGLLLARFADRDDVVFGVCASGRPPQVPHVDSLVGRFGGIVPVRVRPEPQETLEELLLRIRAEWSARPGYYCPSQADMARSLGMDRLLDSVVMFQDDAADLAELSGIIDGIRIAEVDSAPAFADRVAVAVVLNGPIRLSLRYLTEEVSESVANVLSYGLASAIRQIAAAPHTLIADLDLHIEHAPSDAGIGR